MAKVLFFQRTLLQCRLNVFKELHGVTGCILCFGKKGPPNSYMLKVRPDFPHCRVFDFYPFKGKETFVIQDVLTPLPKYKPDIIITDFALAILSNWLLLILRPFFRFRLILWGHGYNKKTGFNPNRYFIDKLRIWFINRADAIIVYSDQNKAIISKYLKNPEKIFIAHNTLDTRELTKLREQMEKKGKDNIKKEIGFNAQYNLIYIGRILKDKEPDRLINVFKMLTKRLDSVALHFIGDGPMVKQLKDITQGLNVKFWGNMTNDYQTGRLLFASDLMVMPGYLGLSVVHSFCFDKPVVSQKRGEQGPFHSPEVEYVIDGKTGFLVKYGNNELMADTIIKYLNDEKKQLMMKGEIRTMVQGVCSIDNMIVGIKKAIDYAHNL